MSNGCSRALLRCYRWPGRLEIFTVATSELDRTIVVWELDPHRGGFDGRPDVR